MGKILKQVICVHLLNSIMPNLSIHRHGFLVDKSTRTALEDVNNWTDEIRPEKHVVAALLHIGGAFDNVKWCSLIKDLKNLGCNPSITQVSY